MRNPLSLVTHSSSNVLSAHLKASFLVQIFVVSSAKIQTRGYETLYEFATANERSLFGRVVLRAPMRLRVSSRSARMPHVHDCIAHLLGNNHCFIWRCRRLCPRPPNILRCLPAPNAVRC